MKHEKDSYIALPTTREWERRSDESAKQFYLFTLYRDQGLDRTQKATQKHYSRLSTDDDTVSLAYIATLSSEHDWVERCKLFDNHYQALKLERKDEVILDMEARHSVIARRFQSFAMEMLIRYDALPDEDKLTVNREAYMFDAISRGMERSLRMERQTYGEPADNLKLLDKLKYDIKDIQKAMKDPKTSEVISNALASLEFDGAVIDAEH